MSAILAAQLKHARKEISRNQMQKDVQFLSYLYGLGASERIRKAVQLYRGINTKDPGDHLVIMMVMDLHLRDHPGAFDAKIKTAVSYYCTRPRLSL